MKTFTNTLAGAGFCLAGFALSPAWATNGTQLTGYGSKAQGMAGVSLAFPQDALAASNNPAGMAFVGHRLDLNAQFIMLRMEGTFGGFDNEGTGFAPVPEIGYNRPLGDQWTIGVSTASGGGAAKYDDQLYTGGPDETKGLYTSTIILPTVTYKPAPDLAFGASLAVGVHVLDLDNLPGVGDHGLEAAAGVGLRAGVLWKPTDTVSVGAMYGSKIDMGELSGYSEDILAPVDGKIDLPEQWGIGVAVELSDRLTLAGDYLRINWSDTQFSDLFGFRSQNVYRVGLSYELRSDLTLRGGVAVADRHFDTDFVNNLPLLPAIDANVVSAGFTKDLGNGRELTGGIEYDFDSRAIGTGPSDGAEMDTDFLIVSIGYGWRF
ncbi:OmpP1/FadL family transporter [Celeribacter indicus]|uniref:Putative fatty acid/hydrocarbon transporter n=1 Tax=Celeribacter indicus TaxID=1208324 RepID=A0A0B5DNV5_9RHOB|nr:outer membrane protein transport protein [Celeribacter indicus]AJE44899.1 putative fatty acid/hydrocarbon transporter [Celeribacter indicus]SDW97718.1 long-chain fatty acid transport protein [Celeribacter indicus]